MRNADNRIFLYSIIFGSQFAPSTYFTINVTFYSTKTEMWNKVIPQIIPHFLFHNLCHKRFICHHIDTVWNWFIYCCIAIFLIWFTIYLIHTIKIGSPFISSVSEILVHKFLHWNLIIRPSMLSKQVHCLLHFKTILDFTSLFWNHTLLVNTLKMQWFQRLLSIWKLYSVI